MRRVITHLLDKLGTLFFRETFKGLVQFSNKLRGLETGNDNVRHDVCVKEKRLPYNSLAVPILIRFLLVSPLNQSYNSAGCFAKSLHFSMTRLCNYASPSVFCM